MNALLSLLIKLVPAAVAKFLVALAGPSIRGLGLLTGPELNAILGYVGQLYLKQTPTYAAQAPYSAIDVQGLAESVHTALVAWLGTTGMTLADADVGALITAIGAELLAKYPAAVA